MNLVDTHAHLFSEYFSEAGEIATTLRHAREKGVVAVLNCATRVEDLDETVALAEAETDVWAAVGIHPHDAKQLVAEPTAVLERLKRLAANSRVVAIGECGLDYHYDHSPREEQRIAFREQIRLALEIGKPLVVHNRESDRELLTILEEERAGDVGGVIHSFSAGVEVAERALALGFHLGFGGMITFNNAHDVRAALRVTPPNRILFETDTPYLTPTPHRGKRNEPGYVGLVAERAAVELQMELVELCEITTANARALFGFVA